MNHHKLPIRRAISFVIGAVCAVTNAPIRGQSEEPLFPIQSKSIHEEIVSIPDDNSASVATVTAVSEGFVYIDRGRQHDLQIGDEIEFQNNDGSRQLLQVDAVSSNHARCQTVQAMPQPNVGTSGIVKRRPREHNQNEVERTPLEPIAPSALQELEAQPLDSRWSAPLDDWNSDLPLLAPAVPLKRHERDADLHGMIFSQYLHTWNWAFADNQYALGRIGADVWIDNPFLDGGGIRFRGDFDIRGTALFDDSDSVDTLGRIDLLSYFNGGYTDWPDRFEIGRFLSNDFPEFGFLDGAEYCWQMSDRQRLGFSLGALPEPFPSLQSGDDWQTAIYYSYRTVPDENLVFGVGYQKSWHLGNPDRDLIVSKLSFRPGPRFNANATIWTDYYGDSDQLKPKGLEVTEAIYNQYFRLTPRLGFGSYYIQIRWPQLLRREIDPIFDLQIIRNRRRTYGGHVWYDLLPRVQLNGRLDLWENQDSFGGTTWESEVVFRQVLDAPLDLTAAFLVTDGLYSSGPGGRVGLATYFPRGMASVSYSVGDYRLTDYADQVLHQGITTTVDFYTASGQSLSLYGDYRFGETQDAASVGVIWRQRLK